MSAVAFVQQLLETGRVRVAASPQPPEGLDDAVELLDVVARDELAHEPPGLDVEVARWALLVLYRGCQSLIYRDLGASAVRDALGAPCPQPADLTQESRAYSADLALHFLPDLYKLARGVAEDDPLVDGLLALARAWPLSSVGMPGTGEALNVEAFIAHPSLRRLYADRIIERADVSRLREAAVRDAVREAIGAYDELSPRVAAALAQETQTCP